MTISELKFRLLNILVSIFLVVLFFLPEFKMGLPLIHIFIVLLIAYVMLTINDKNIFPFLKFDNIKIALFAYIFITTITYVFYSTNTAELQDNYARLTGNRPAGLYFKVALNGFFAMLTFGFAYSYGKLIANRKSALEFIVAVIIYLCLINAVANIAQWVISTGGVVARYNFKPPFIPSQGTSVGFSILGFLLLLSTNVIKKKIYRLLFLFLLALSIVIIVTRQAQLSFVLIIIIYYMLKSEKFSLANVFKFTAVSLIFGVALYFLYTILDISDLFVEASSSDSVDFIVRFEAFTEAYRIFSEHPLLGVGYGLFSLYNQIFVLVAGELIFLASAHNGLVSIAAESGIVGLINMFILIYIIFNKMFKARTHLRVAKHEKFNFMNAIIAMILINTLGLFISNFFLFPPPSEYSYIGMSFITWLFIGVSVGFVKAEIQKRKNA
jgi:O-antigen ligase